MNIILKPLIIIFVKIYKWFISPILGRNCRYTPSCSSYMIDAVEHYGVRKGVLLGIKRFCKCHPFANTHFEKTKGYDPVPLKEEKK